MPLKLWKYPDIQTWIDAPGWEYNKCAGSNRTATFLMMETDVHSFNWGWTILDWNPKLGSVLVVREDKQDLDVDYVRLLCRFVRVKLQPMVEAALVAARSIEQERRSWVYYKGKLEKLFVKGKTLQDW